MIRNNIEYIKLFMKYESKDMPIAYLYEVNLDDERLALRAIEIFEDRKLIKMDDLYRDVIEIFPIPTVDEFNAKIWGDGFHAFIISKEEFEECWESDIYSGNLSAT